MYRGRWQWRSWVVPDVITDILVKPYFPQPTNDSLNCPVNRWHASAPFPFIVLGHWDRGRRQNEPGEFRGELQTGGKSLKGANKCRVPTMPIPTWIPIFDSWLYSHGNWTTYNSWMITRLNPRENRHEAAQVESSQIAASIIEAHHKSQYK